ncbi:MAG TPA: multiheme c-type cytochrome [Candidatus Sulfotelmatobacter sp.]
MCHQKEAQAYAETAHHLTSRLPSKNSIAGKFTPGSNVLKTSNPYLSYSMTATRDGYFESAVEELSPSKTISHTERIDVVIGSGRKGQTFLFWKGDKLFELPVSYWTELDNWINSPGYPDGSPHFDKPVVPRCLECHGTSFQWVPPPANRYIKTSLVLGITCEKCHGPGREHVARHSSKNRPSRGETGPGQSGPGPSKSILNPASFPRDRQIDTCSLCHAGAAEAIAPPLSFVPGEPIDEYLYIPVSDKDVPVDVHGNQIQLLKKSRCFQSSQMTCTTCHNVHERQRDAPSFSVHCLSCHKVEACGRYPKLGAAIANNCVDCHMPLQESELLVSDTNGRKLKPRVRNHRIAIYPGEGAQ